MRNNWYSWKKLPPSAVFSFPSPARVPRLQVAGIGTLEDGTLTRRPAAGKPAALEVRLASAPLFGTSGIGRTQSATHGKPVERNAHPHSTLRVGVVHNGIIENFAELREELSRDGVVFESNVPDTDHRSAFRCLVPACGG